MNSIEELLKTHCPNGVEYKPLGELGVTYNGLNGKKKDDFENGNAKYISYLNVFNNLSVKINGNDLVKISPNEKQNTIKFGDILFTTSSETYEECGMSSVVTSQLTESIYLNSFCFGFRFYDETLFLPGFTKYLFRNAPL